ncbi:hypothetical protein [Methylibium sp.]|nr:hypothetical protein [Methylibium sp.]
MVLRYAALRADPVLSSLRQWDDVPNIDASVSPIFHAETAQ